MMTNDANDDTYDVPTSNEAPVPTWLKWVYFTLPFWGFATLYLFWQGSTGGFDPASWHRLQQAANTVYPYNDASK